MAIKHVLVCDNPTCGNSVDLDPKVPATGLTFNSVTYATSPNKVITIKNAFACSYACAEDALVEAARLAEIAEAEAANRPRRGRKPGSKNKKPEAPAPATDETAPAETPAAEEVLA